MALAKVDGLRPGGCIAGTRSWQQLRDVPPKSRRSLSCTQIVGWFDWEMPWKCRVAHVDACACTWIDV